VKILFDQGTPVPLLHALSEHIVSTAHEMGWGNVDNGQLPAAAKADFDVLQPGDFVEMSL